MLKYFVLSKFILLSLVNGLPFREEWAGKPGIDKDDFGLNIFNDTNGNVIPQPRYGQLAINDKTYTLFFQPLNWHAALEFCNSQNQVIGSVENSDENSNLINTLGFYGLLDSGFSFWLGASDLANSRKWSWINKGQIVLFTNWSTGEPNNANGTEHCLELLSNGQWNDLDCNEQRQVICQDRPLCTHYDSSIYI